MKAILCNLFESYQSAEYIDDWVIEVVLPIIPKHIGSIISLTKIYCANVDVSNWSLDLYATREDYESGKATETMKIGLCYGRAEDQIGRGPSETTEGSY